MSEPFTFSRIEETNLSTATDAQIARLVEVTYPVDFGGRSFMHQRHHFRLLAHEGDELVGHVAVLLRAIRIGEALVDIMGLAEVATAKAHRRRGIASQLVAMAQQQARQSTAQFVLLFGTERLYRTAGFMPVGNTVRAVRLPQNRSGDAYDCGKQPLMVYPVAGAKWDEAASVDLVGPIF